MTPAKKKSAVKKDGGSISETRRAFVDFSKEVSRDVQALAQQAQNTGMSRQEAELWAYQTHFNNLRMFGQPIAAAQHLMADLKSRIDLDRMMNPDAAPLDKQTLKLFEEMRKTIKLMSDVSPKQLDIRTTNLDDDQIKFGEFIDIDVEVSDNE